MKCPECRSTKVTKNGTIPAVKSRRVRRIQTYLCHNCYRRFRGKDNA